MVINGHFGEINVRSQSRNSMISVGEVNMPGWTYYAKSNYGNGFYIGLNHTKLVIGNANDMDGIDNPINTPRSYPSVQSQGL
ncbi:hypothetical protein [Scopulibacillus cellulosilyticus]|uniref:Spore germination protein GerPA/GerPF n=1 Tax=Scopulibacillus cellulosilyticus TaxID=2665665 RepID=A0ABW2Q1Z8_9BACL